MEALSSHSHQVQPEWTSCQPQHTSCKSLEGSLEPGHLRTEGVGVGNLWLWQVNKPLLKEFQKTGTSACRTACWCARELETDCKWIPSPGMQGPQLQAPRTDRRPGNPELKHGAQERRQSHQLLWIPRIWGIVWVNLVGTLEEKAWTLFLDSLRLCAYSWSGEKSVLVALWRAWLPPGRVTSRLWTGVPGEAVAHVCTRSSEADSCQSLPPHPYIWKTPQ